MSTTGPALAIAKDELRQVEKGKSFFVVILRHICGVSRQIENAYAYCFLGTFVQRKHINAANDNLCISYGVIWRIESRWQMYAECKTRMCKEVYNCRSWPYLL